MYGKLRPEESFGNHMSFSNIAANFIISFTRGKVMIIFVKINLNFVSVLHFYFLTFANENYEFLIVAH